MRFKYIFLGLMLLILAGSITAIGAYGTEDVGILEDKLFTIPDDFEILEQTANNAYMRNSEDDESFVVTVLDEDTDPQAVLDAFEDSGYEYNKTYTVYQRGPYRVTQIGFTYKDYIGYMFVCINGDDRVIISHGFQDKNDFPKGDDKEAFKLIDSLQDNL